MKKRDYLTMWGVAMLAIACTKNKPKQFSTWYINSDSFTTNEVGMYIDRGGNSLYSVNAANGFKFYNGGSGYTHEPEPGLYLLSADYESSDPTLKHAAFYYKGAFYRLIPGRHDTLVIAQPGGKYRYTMFPGWYINTADASDSVQIHGVFNEP